MKIRGPIKSAIIIYKIDRRSCCYLMKHIKYLKDLKKKIMIISNNELKFFRVSECWFVNKMIIALKMP